MRRYGFSIGGPFPGPWPEGVSSTEGRKLPWGWLYRIEADAATFSNGIPGLTLLPSLQAPANKLSAPVLSFLAAQGITPQAGDTLLNVLRALRDAGGENDRSFDISLQD
jgi:hypothetical protein